MYPHERSLVQKLKSEPFVLLGVDSDPEDTIKKVIKEGKVTWPCIVDGGDANGPNATKWNVEAWPTIILIDHRGIIRNKKIYDEEEIDRELKKLIAEAKSDAGKNK